MLQLAGDGVGSYCLARQHVWCSIRFETGWFEACEELLAGEECWSLVSSQCLALLCSVCNSKKASCFYCPTHPLYKCFVHSRKFHASLGKFVLIEALQITFDWFSRQPFWCVNGKWGGKYSPPQKEPPGCINSYTSFLLVYFHFWLLMLLIHCKVISEWFNWYILLSSFALTHTHSHKVEPLSPYVELIGRVQSDLSISVIRYSNWGADFGEWWLNKYNGKGGTSMCSSQNIVSKLLAWKTSCEWVVFRVVAEQLLWFCVL